MSDMPTSEPGLASNGSYPDVVRAWREQPVATILVVDDRATNRAVLVALLEPFGHRMLEAADGQEALALVEAACPELVICDIVMPTMDGYEFVRQLRARPGIGATRVIFHTAHYHLREAAALARAVGVSSVIAKPSEPADVLRSVHDTLAAPGPAPSTAPDFEREHLRLVTDKLSATVSELASANRRLHALIELNLQLVALREPAQLLDHVCRGVCELIGSSHCAINVREPGNGQAAHFHTCGLSQEVVSRLGRPAFDKGVLGMVIAERRPLRSAYGRRPRRVAGLPRGYPAVHAFVAAPITSPTSVFGWLCATDKVGADEFSADDEVIVSLLAAMVGRAYASGSVYARLQRKAAEQLQSLPQRLIEVQESERRQIARELHDRVGQNLTALGINLDILQTRAEGQDCVEMETRLDDSIALVEATADAIENVMTELRPPMLDDHGLLSALDWYAKAFSRRTGVEVVVRGNAPPRRPGHEFEMYEMTLFRIVQEALNNVAKHASARRVEIALGPLGTEYALAVSDDGIGFDPAAASRSGRGLATMRERTLAVGGQFDLHAAPGAGTRLAVRLPLQ
jgi:signal transduction histidine kinase/DNA-binding response OmpR family regulator